MTRKAQNSAKAAQTTENSYNCLCPAVVIFFYKIPVSRSWFRSASKSNVMSQVGHFTPQNNFI